MTLKKRSPWLQAFEVVTVTILISGVGYLINKNDPLLIHYHFSFLILWLAIITLFYGLMMGMVMWLFFAIIAVMFYRDDPIFTTVLLENLFFVFLYGLFFSNLHNEIDRYKIKTNYLKLRLKELTNAFFTLKISHDKLESIYIIQPASIRFVISEILESSDHVTPQQSAENTLKVLRKFFGVNSAIICQVKRNTIRDSYAHIGDIGQNINKKDKLIQEALTLKKAIYLNDIEDREQTDYIYAVPFLDKREDIVAILIIKEIPFLFFHEDTLLKISVAFNYIWTEYKKRASLKKIQESKKDSIALKNRHERQDFVDFKLEVARLNNILKGYKIDSRIYSLYTRNEFLDKEIKDFMYQNEEFEILDQYISIECGHGYVHFILFPFVSAPTIHSRAKLLDKEMDKLESRYRVERLEENLQEYIGEKGYERLRKKHISVKNFNALLKEYGCA